MADLFDRFTDPMGVLTGHASDQGSGTWGPSGSILLKLNGSGAVGYSSGWAGFGNIAYSSWTPPSANYEVQVVLGPNFPTNWVGVCARCSGAVSTPTYYVAAFNGPTSTDGSGPNTVTVIPVVGGTAQTPLGTLSTAVQASGSTLAMQITGTGATVTITLLVDGVSAGSVTDSTSGRIVSTGSAGLLIADAAAGIDSVRTIWAGSIGGPGGITIAPPTVTVLFNATQGFALSTAFTNEAFAWSSLHGTTPGTASSTTYTAPSSGSTDTVTGASSDLPLRTVGAAVTLMSGAATAYTLTNASPSTGLVGSLSNNFTLQLNGTPASSVIITPSDSADGGTFTPTTLTFSDTTPGTFKYTPVSAGTKAISSANNGGLTDPSPVNYLAVNPMSGGSRVYYSVVSGFPGGSNLIGFTIYNSDGTVYQARTTSGVIELGTNTGTYSITLLLPRLAAYEVRWDTGTGSPSYASDSVQLLSVPVDVVKNTALNNFKFVMLGTDNVTPVTGAVVTAKRAIDGGAFSNCTNPVIELSNGWYRINFSASDMNGDVIALKFTAPTATTRNLEFVTNQ